MKLKPLAVAVLAAALTLPAIARAGEALERAEAACDAHEWPEALRWFEVAAEDGDRRAQQVAGLMNLYGDRLYPGVERNWARAVAWLHRAEAQGSVEARSMLARLQRDPSLDPARLAAGLDEVAPGR